MEKLVPFLVAEGCVFKLARSRQVLHELNDGRTVPESVGKAFTVYPDQDLVREVGLRLARTLRGHEGPRVLSDRRVSADAPVYYRYGGFVTRRSTDVRGQSITRLRGPAGEEFDEAAGLSYRQPSWVEDPFAGAHPDPAPGRSRDDLLLSGRYRVVVGIREAAQGNVYRAVDERTGHQVVVKQARAFVAEHGDGNDGRLRLRNERRVLEALDGVAGVPRFLDHFRYGEDEFLVTTDRGPLSLAEDVRRNGPYRTGPGAGARSLDRLAGELARILTAVHERGVMMRDLSAANVVIGDGASLIDFGLASYDGLHLSGMTPGYAPARQVRGEPPRDADDLHALGMTLVYAATGLHPVTLGDDPELPRTRALQTISRYHGRTPSGTMSAVVDLLGDEERARAALRRLASGDGRRTVFPSSPPAPVVTADVAAEVLDNLLGDLLDLVDGVLEAPASTKAANDASVYSGSAGIGLELLHHRHRPAAERRLRELVAFTVRVTAPLTPQPGLFTGVTGTDMFLQEAGNCGISLAGWPGRSLPPPEWRAEAADLTDGEAGVGLGHLYFHRVSGDPADLEAARRCARIVAAEPPPPRTSRPGEADLAAGRAHGLAGTAELLLALAEETGESWVLEAAADRVRLLSERTRVLVREAQDPAAEPMTMSWCRGLPGIGPTLLHASKVLGDPSLSDLARQGADVCVARMSRLSALGRCCGVAGVGNHLLDLADLEQSERYREAAYDLAAHLLLRSAGSPTHPTFFASDDPPARSLSWAQGLTGVLSFFRRLAYGGPDCLAVVR
ncbi:protein kinase/lanthionine synthetase C family protein [Nonomuraea sp. SMC257]|uniref:non-specific serine/threonine protein kinase n=1 Tax=Nonomuraea montanisoli TaxID=2741721 RepID=A0A7Y6IEW6_9ACTN|nr:protein kinase/lanthionine synthetase C family protein [Nonomuraea montanisoli]